jgi:hypothetical protein
MKTKKFGMHNDVKLYIINVQYDRGKKKERDNISNMVTKKIFVCCFR